MTTSESKPRHRNLAAPLHKHDLWADLPQFVGFVMHRSLSTDLRPGHCVDHCKAETDLAGTLLLLLVLAGAFPRVTVHTELTELTTSNFPICRTWFAIDAYKPRRRPSGTRKPSKRQQKLRFPLPPLCLALLYRLVRFYALHGAADPDRFPGQSGPHVLDLTANDEPLFSSRIRTKKRFFIKWLKSAYRDFQTSPQVDTGHPLGTAHKPPTTLSFEQFMNACQIRRLQDLSPWIVAALSQQWKSCPSEPLDVIRLLLNQNVQRNSHRTRDRSLEQNDQHAREQSPPIPIVKCYVEFPPPLAEAYSQVTEALASMHADMTRDERHAVLSHVQHTRRTFGAVVGLTPNGLLKNAGYLLQWLEWALSGRSLSPETILKHYKKLQVFIFHSLDDVSLTDIDEPDELIDIICDCMDCYDNPGSQAEVRKSFQSFLNWMANEGLIEQIKWNNIALHVYRDAKDRAIVSFEDIDKLLRDIDQSVEGRRFSSEQAARYRIFIILCFFLGLRSREAVRLMLTDFDVTHHGILLWILRSKTRHGIRCLPADLLIPEPYLTELVTFYHRVKEQAGLSQATPLLPDDDGNLCRSSYYGKRIGKRMKKVLDYGSPHDLRHGFATWFLVRSDFLLHGKPCQLSSSEFDHPVFQQPAMTQFSHLLFSRPLSAVSRGEQALARPIALLSRLLGHSCPEITLSIYAHSLDWIYYFALLRQEDNPTLLGTPVRLGPQQAANLLVQSPENQSQNEFSRTPTLRTILMLQQSQLGLSSD
ncbi:MAG: tyrosine-type recombinase/integrase [Nitrospira sp. CR1.1]|nr:tyrosine-type recombinase/integrase [Nitrospira sp. CR1.1]